MTKRTKRWPHFDRSSGSSFDLQGCDTFTMQVTFTGGDPTVVVELQATLDPPTIRRRCGLVHDPDFQHQRREHVRPDSDGLRHTGPTHCLQSSGVERGSGPDSHRETWRDVTSRENEGRGERVDAGRPKCRHCRARIVCCSRGLCDRCYSAPDVRKLYPATSDRWRRGPGNIFRNAPLPDRPTDAPPGSPEKVAVLKQRVEAGMALWHPGDAVAGNRTMKRRITTLAAEVRTLAIELAGDIAGMPDHAESPVLARVELAMQETVAKLRAAREAVAAMPTLSIAPEEGDGEDAA